MPKDESDAEDPLELRGVGLLTDEDTSEVMTECFVEEFMRLGYSPNGILALFRNPHYTGMNRVFQNRGEGFVREKIAEVFGWWKRPVSWNETADGRSPDAASDACPQAQKPVQDMSAAIHGLHGSVSESPIPPHEHCL